MSSIKTVLVVDDSAFMRASIQKALEETGRYEVIGEAADGQSAYQMAESLQPQAITLDNILPDQLGYNLISDFKQQQPEVKILMVSAVRQKAVIKEAVKEGADGYIGKPFSDNELIRAIDDLF